MTPKNPADVHARFLRVVERGLAKADAEISEELAKLKPAPPRLKPGEAFRYRRKPP